MILDGSIDISIELRLNSKITIWLQDFRNFIFYAALYMGMVYYENNLKNSENARPFREGTNWYPSSGSM